MRHATAGYTHTRPALERLEERLLLDGMIEQQAIELFNASPALFVENQGQWVEESLRYAFQGDGANVLFTDAGLVFQVFQAFQAEAAEDADGPFGGAEERFAPEQAQMRAAEFSVSFEGANEVAPLGLDQAQTSFNYLLGEASNWRTGVGGYSKVAYAGLYSGVDLEISGRRDGLKYEFSVAPGADYTQIQVSYCGIEGLSIDAAGALHVQTQAGELIDDAPYICQEIGGQRVEVAGGFQLLGSSAYGFTITGAYDATQELIIDPDLVWVTYLGGGSGDLGQGVAVDSAGDAYVTGWTQSPGLATPGAYDTTPNGNVDVLVAKLSSSGSQLLYCTYLGGGDYDWGYGIAVDSAGNAYVTGYTDSAGWATPGAYDTTYNGGSYDVFVAKVSSTGSDLLYATYLGGAGDDDGEAIAVDSAGNAYVTGWTTSPGWATPGAYDMTLDGYQDAFVVKLNSTGSELLYSSYLGGDDDDAGNGIAVDSDANAYVTGETWSEGWATPGAYDTTHNGRVDVLVAKLSSTGSQLVYATYLGGGDYDWGYGIAVDSAGNAYVTGETYSSGWATPGAYDTTYNGGRDAFVAKLSSTGSQLLYATYLGAVESDWGAGIAVDSAGNAYVTGGTYSSDWATPGAYDATYNGGWDAFMARLSSAGSQLLYSTYLGGSGLDRGNGIAVDTDGNVYVTGETRSEGWATPGAYDTTYGYGQDVFVARSSAAAFLPVPGDANGDGLVEGADYTVWADNYLSQPVPAWSDGGWAFGNFTEDDVVEGGDYTIWADNYTGGGGASPGASAQGLESPSSRLADPPGGANGDLTEALLEQGVPPERIVGVDSDGIPLVSGVPGDGESASSPPQPAGAAALPQDVRGWEAIPGVIRNDGIETFRVEVDVNGPVAAVTLDNISRYLLPPGPEPVSLRDDGSGGDLVAGDFIFTSGPFRYDTTVTMPEFYSLQPDSPAGLYATSVGSLTIEELDATTTRLLEHPQYGLLRSDIPQIPTVNLSADVAASPHLINVRSGNREIQRYLRQGLGGDLRNLTNPIYGVLPDDFDFFMLLSTCKLEKVPWLSSNNFTSGIHIPVQVNYTGSGYNPFDASGQFGSAGRLLSVNILDAYDRGINGSNATHELVHQWASHTSMSLGLSDGTGHYNFRSSAASLVGGFEWIDNGDGTFTVNVNEGRGRAHHAPPLDKYMMGLIDAADVPPIYVYSESLPYPGQLVDPIGPGDIALTVTIDDIIGVHGVRTPGPATAQRDFTIAFVAESQERLLNPTEMTFYEILARHYTKELPPAEPDPYVFYGWQPITRFFGEGTTWSSLIEAVLPVPGDANGDGLVEGADYTVWADNYLSQAVSSWSDGGWVFGNFNDDDVVEGGDYTIWADNYSPPAPPAAAAGAAQDGVSAQAAASFAASAEDDPPAWRPEAGNSAALDRQHRVLPMAAGEARVLPLGPGLPAEACGQDAYPTRAWVRTSARTTRPDRHTGLDDKIDILTAPELSVLPAAPVGRAVPA